jgi:hypothetical protein
VSAFLYVVPLLVLVAAFVVQLVRGSYVPMRSMTNTRSGRVFAIVWVIAALPIAAVWFIGAFSVAKPSTARVADGALAILIVAGCMKAVAAIRPANRAK